MYNGPTSIEDVVSKNDFEPLGLVIGQRRDSKRRDRFRTCPGSEGRPIPQPSRLCARPALTVNERSA